MLQPNQNINLDNDSNFTTFYNQLGEKIPTLIRIFDRGDNYTLHGEDAIYVAKEFYKTTAILKFNSNDIKKLCYLVLNKPNFENLIKNILLVKNYCIEIYKGSSSKNDWKLDIKASPGNLWEIEDVLYNSCMTNTSSNLLSLKLKMDSNQNHIGVAYYEDDGKFQFLIYEFIDNNNFTNLEALLVHLSPKECIFSSTQNVENEKLKEIFENHKILLTERKKGDFTTADIVQDLNKLLKFGTNQTPNFATFNEYKNAPVALSALSAIIKYLDLLGKDRCHGVYNLETLDISQHMKLDVSSIRALNLFPEIFDANLSSNMGDVKPQNLYDLLNKCVTQQGQRLLQRWIKQPLLDVNKIDERLNVVELLMENQELRKNFQDNHLRRMPDFQKLAKKFMKKKASLQDIFRIYKAIKWLPYMLDSLDVNSSTPTPKTSSLKRKGITDLVHTTPTSSQRGINESLGHMFCHRLSTISTDFTKYVEMCETMIDLERAETSHEYLIKPEFDENLSSLKESLDKLENRINKHFQNVANDLCLDPGKSIKLEYASAPLGYYFRVTKKEEKGLRNSKRYKTIDTNKNGVRFKDDKLEDLNQLYISTRDSYEENQKVVVGEIMNIAAGYVNPLIRLTDVTAEIDVLVSFAETAISCSAQTYIRPKILPKEDRIIDIKQARNPCMEIQDNMSFIPNDVYFKEDDTIFYIVTGPNMGGKSTYIRTAGLVILMAQIGCFIPCSAINYESSDNTTSTTFSQPQISIIDGIHCRIGSADSQSRGVSTFMAEMIETTAILKQATKYSLIIIDELGRGTSTYDGFGLAWAISEHIILNIGCFTFFATHFHELTQLAHEISSSTSNNPTSPKEIVKNIHVTAIIVDDDEIVHEQGQSKDSNEIIEVIADNNEQIIPVDNPVEKTKKLILLYKIKRGVCDRSFGIHIAKMAHFPESVIKMAKEKAEELGDISYDDYYTNENELDNVDFYRDKKVGLKLIQEFLAPYKNHKSVLDIGNLTCEYKEQIQLLLKEHILKHSADNVFLKRLVKRYNM